MKRALSSLLALMMCLGLCSCGDITADTVHHTEPSASTSSTIPESAATEPSATEPDIHSHDWKPATCTAPKTCETCQATEGVANDHDWEDATCIAPKTCKTCQTTEGAATGHDWKDATCTEPKTCICGATDGDAKGHDWRDATCSEPKTCSVCAATSGLTAGHSFVSGKCMTCGKADPDSKQGAMVWIPTKGGKKYHTNPECSNMIDPDKVTEAEAEALGFTPCKRCH